MSRHTPIFIAHQVFKALRGKTNNKPPVIFMHGLLESKETWKRIPERVANERKRLVYAYDARNHGQSGHTMDSNFDNNLYDLYHFMDTMNIEKAILVGHSMGGMTAIRAALDKPERVEIAFVVNMHVDRIKPVAIHRYLNQMLRQAEDICTIQTDKPNLALVNVPPPHKELKKYKKLLNSVLVFRCLALADALLQYDDSPSSSDLYGMFFGPAYFIYGPRNIMCGKRIYSGDIFSFFPNAGIIPMTEFANDLFTDQRLVKAICDRIP